MVLLKHCLIHSLNYLLKIQINIIHKGVGRLLKLTLCWLLLLMRSLSDLTFVLQEMQDVN
jgi:hypothetical protein